MTLSRRFVVPLLVVMFLLAVLLRAYHPISRPVQRLERSLAFNAAIDAQDWAATYQHYHPGYTTMWVGGMALRLYEALQGTPAGAIYDWAAPAYATEYGRQMVAGVMGLAVVLSALDVAVILALRRLSGWGVALSAGGLLLFSPYYLSQSRVLHVDALLSVLMILSALLLLIGLQEGKRRYLLVSGLLGGFALLTKTPAVFLVPFTGLALLIHLVPELRAGWSGQAKGRFGWLVRQSWLKLVLPFVLWLLMAALAFALWPAMWVNPMGVIGMVLSGAEEHLLNPHIKPRFFFGQVYEDVTLPVYYLVALALNSSFLTLPLVLIALGHYGLWRRCVDLPLRPRVFWLLLAYACFFTLQMMLGSKQTERYTLPAHLALEILAAVGLVGLIGLLQRAIHAQHARLAGALPAILITLTVGLQAVAALPYAPAYGAHQNHLLGGNRVAVKLIELMDQNEGLIYAAEYLSQQPNPELLRLGSPRPHHPSLLQYYSGQWADGPLDEMDYYLIGLRTVQRQFPPLDWVDALEALKGQPPQVVVRYDGVEYVWLYKIHPLEPVQTLVVRRGGIGLVGLAWVWTLATLAALLWALRRVSVIDGGKVAERSV